jgi:hypothetical protein
MCLAGLVQADGQTHTDTRIIVIFAYVAFLEVSEMTYSSERDTQKANEREGTWTKRIGTKHLGEKRIGDKTYWQQNISATKHIGNKTYRRQIVSGTKRIGNKRYGPIADKTYRGQNVSAD